MDIKYSRLAAGQLTTASPTASTTLTVTDARLFEFALVSAAADSAATGGATLTVRDGSGKVVLTLSQDKGGTTNGALYLAPGTYSVEITAPGGVTNYWAGVRVASGPVGPYDSGTSTTYPTSPDGSDGAYTSGGSSPPPPESPPTQPASDGTQTTQAAPPPPTGPDGGYGGYYGF